MQLVWQEGEEWWGVSAIAYSEDIKATINQMDEKCFWYLREDEAVLAKGVLNGRLEAAKKVATAQLGRILKQRRIKSFFRRDNAARKFG